jgi:hypothetical protein
MEDRIDGTTGLSGGIPAVPAEQKTLRTLFRTVPQKRKMLGIPF